MFLLTVVLFSAIGNDLEQEFSNDDFGIGLTMFRGSGLIGPYFYVRPLSFVSLEVTGGIRVFLDLLGSNVYFPYMTTGKLQFYFMGRQTQTQLGLEVFGSYAQDAGPAVGCDFIIKYRLTRHLNLDACLGAGYFVDKETTFYRYTASLGYASHEVEGLIPNSFFILYGFGISYAF